MFIFCYFFVFWRDLLVQSPISAWLRGWEGHNPSYHLSYGNNGEESKPHGYFHWIWCSPGMFLFIMLLIILMYYNGDIFPTSERFILPVRWLNNNLFYFWYKAWIVFVLVGVICRLHRFQNLSDIYVIDFEKTKSKVELSWWR